MFCTNAALRRRHRRVRRPAFEALEPRTLFTISVTFSTYNLMGSTPTDTLASNGWVGVLVTAVSNANPIGGFDLDSSGGGIFGTFTQQTTLTNGTASTPTGTTPTAAAGSTVDVSDSFFSNFSNFNYMPIISLAEDNNGSSHPATNLQTSTGDYSYVPLADTGAINYGIGSRLHGAGVFNLSTATSIPLAFVIVPEGSTLHVVGQFTDTSTSTQKFSVNQSFIAPTAPNTIATSTFFYNDSSYDGYSPGINAQDDNAIALDKTALLPGHAATFANYTSYDKGINGILFDMTAMPGTLSAADFTFKEGGTGSNSNPSNWVTGPAPNAILARPGAGIGGSTRVELTWSDGTIVNHWLQVVVKGDANTGLAADKTFYFGNAVGDTGDSATNSYITAVDEIGARFNAANLTGQPVAQAITNVYDFNRDRQVNSVDQNVAGANYTNFTNALDMLSAPAVPAAAPLAASAGIVNSTGPSAGTLSPAATTALAPTAVTTVSTNTLSTMPALSDTTQSDSDADLHAPLSRRRHWSRRHLFDGLNFLVTLAKR